MTDAPASRGMSRRSFLLTLAGAGRCKPVSAPRTGHVRLAVQGTCRACGACARSCAETALRLSTDGREYRLLFQPGLCTGCGLCLKTCLAGCLVRLSDETAPAAPSPLVLAQGVLLSCRRCRAAAAVLDENGRCPVCARAAQREG